MVNKVSIQNHLEICKSKSDNPYLNVAGLQKRFTYPNPRHAEAARLGFSTFGIPKTICLVEETGSSLILPRGLIANLFVNNPFLQIEDRTVTRPAEFSASQITLKNYQVEPVNKMSVKFQGLLHAPSGAGKTVMGIEIVLRQGQRSLILVHNKELLQQWVERVMTFTTITPGVISAGRFDIKPITIGMVQSLIKPLDSQFINQFGLVLLDECHHCPATTFQTLISQFPARYRYGLTATPERRDGLSFLLHAVMGPIQATVEQEELFANGHILKPTIRVIHTNCYLPECRDYGHLLAMLTKDKGRNDLILEHVIKEARAGHFCLVLSERISHAKELHLLFMKMFPDGKAAVITGGDGKSGGGHRGYDGGHNQRVVRHQTCRRGPGYPTARPAIFNVPSSK
jgi:superfamily II DNA or RNA helicase